MREEERTSDNVGHQMTSSERTAVVIRNGLSFVDRGIQLLWQDGSSGDLKHSVISFYTGIELLVKARLMQEHWSLIVSEPGKAKLNSFESGNFQSVGHAQAIKRLAGIAGVEIDPRAVKAFDEIRRHRNQMVHFYHPIDLAHVSKDQQKLTVLKEQCRGWFYLRRLLESDWADCFAAYASEIQDINAHMKLHYVYLQEVFDQIEPDLEKFKSAGVSIGECEACNFPAHVLSDIGPQETRCRVCLQEQSFIVHPCSDEECGVLTILYAEEIQIWKCEECNSTITLDQVLEAHTDEGKLPQKELLSGLGFATCCECEFYPKSVGTNHSEIFCFHCFSWHSSIGVCDCCSETVTGGVDDSYWSGCTNCGGVGAFRVD